MTESIYTITIQVREITNNGDMLHTDHEGVTLTLCTDSYDLIETVAEYLQEDGESRLRSLAGVADGIYPYPEEV